MMKNKVTESELKAELARRCMADSNAGIARAANVTPQFIGQVLLGVCPVSPKLAKYLGYKPISREREFEKIRK